MTIYKGSQKQGTIYKGSTKIGRIYKGSQLVYQSAFKLYCITKTSDGTTVYSYVLGELKVGSPVAHFSTSNQPNSEKIKSISGSLGASGSKITSVSNYVTRYLRAFNLSGKNIYLYIPKDAGGSGIQMSDMYVFQNSKVNSVTLLSISASISDGNNYYRVKSISGNNIVVSNADSSYTVTMTRNSAYDKFWNENGVY